MKPQDMEKRIREIGSEIYSQAIASTPSLFDRRRWKGKVLEWAMRDEAFKIQLFRFIDVLPSLKSDSSVIRLLKEYFSGERIDLLGIFKVGVKDIPERGLMTKAAAKAVRANVRLLARGFIAGSNTDEALGAIKDLRKEGYALSIYLLGEVVVSDKEASEYVNRCLGLLDRLLSLRSMLALHTIVSAWPENLLLDRDEKVEVLRLNISIKVSSLYSQLDPIDWEGSIENTKANLRPILRKAKEIGAAITFDMEQYYFKDLLFAIFKSILEEAEFKDYTFAGIALQTYLKDAKNDLLSLLGWAREKDKVITVRLVKGAYWDYETVINKQKGWPVPVFLNKGETDLNFEELTKILMENSNTIRPAIGTHNIRSIASAIAVGEALNIPHHGFEFQMLYGMAEPIRAAVAKMGYRVRVYTPVGDLIQGMAYLVRRLLENTSNESFLRRSFVEGVPFDELICPPQAPFPPLTKGGETPISLLSAKEDENPLPYPSPLSGEGKGEGGDLRGLEGFRNEPLTDFSKSENRERMRDSLEKIRRGFNRKYPLYIGGQEIWSDKEITSLNPSSSVAVVGRVSSATTREADMALENARKAWEEWRKVETEGRASYLFKIAERITKEWFDLAALEVYEVGKTWEEADSDVAEAIDYLNYYGSEIIRLGPRRMGNFPGEVNDYLYEPRGVGVVISPWNFPLAIPTGMVSASIVTGNCVILKSSGLSPVIGWRLVEIFNDVGLPHGVLQYLPGPGTEIGEYLVGHPEVDFIAFTGSKEVGLRIVELAGRTPAGQRNIKRVIAEMGGKNAIIVDETADLDEAIKGVIESAFSYQGQKCSACSRVIVAGEVYEEFCERFKEAAKSIRIGPPERPGNFMGPVIDEAALKKIQGYIDLGGSACIERSDKKEGRPYLIRMAPGDGNFVGPAIFVDIAPEARIAQEEIFGPVVSIIKARDINNAIGIANSTTYALTGGIFSRSPGNILKARREFRVGNLYINRGITGALVGRQPFGGFWMSGVGSKAGGPDYLLQFMNPVCVSENTLRKGFTPK